MEKHVRELTQSSIICIVSRTVERTPRPSANALHGLQPDEVTHAKFLCMRHAADCEFTYVLVMKYDIRTNTWLHACAIEDNDAATKAFSRWFASFICMIWSVTN